MLITKCDKMFFFRIPYSMAVVLRSPSNGLEKGSGCLPFVNRQHVRFVTSSISPDEMARKRRATNPDPKGLIKIAGYVAIQLPGDEESSRWIYLRPHAADVLFIANLPLNASVESIRRVVPTSADGVDDVVVQRMPQGSSCFARVRLNGGAAHVQAALEAPSDWLALESLDEDSANLSRPQDWISAYWRARNLDAVQKWSSATMETFERCERAREHREKAEAEAGSKPDSDGFVTVRRGTNAVDASSGTMAAAFSSVARERRTISKKKREKAVAPGIAPDGFYRWQRRQGRKRELDELRKRFEDDKKRVAAVRRLSVD